MNFLNPIHHHFIGGICANFVEATATEKQVRSTIDEELVSMAKTSCVYDVQSTFETKVKFTLRVRVDDRIFYKHPINSYIVSLYEY